MDTVIGILDEGQVRYLTLNRPGCLNALNRTVLDELRRCVDLASRDRVGCLVIRGAGDRAFCAGADLEEISGLESGEAHAFIRSGHQAMSVIENSRVPVIAAVDGFALGGGFELMLACHIVLASDRSSFGLPEAKIGCMPGFGGTQRLFAAVSKAVGYRILLGGDRFDAQRAWEIGLLSAPPVEETLFAHQVRTLAESLAASSRSGTRSILEAAGRATRSAGLEHEAALAALAIASPDGREGINSFTERRKPIFTQEGDR